MGAPYQNRISSWILHRNTRFYVYYVYLFYLPWNILIFMNFFLFNIYIPYHDKTKLKVRIVIIAALISSFLVIWVKKNLTSFEIWLRPLANRTVFCFFGTKKKKISW